MSKVCSRMLRFGHLLIKSRRKLKQNYVPLFSFALLLEIVHLRVSGCNIQDAFQLNNTTSKNSKTANAL